MLNLGVVAEDSTIYIPLPSRAATGAGTAFSATLEEADFDVHKDGSTTALTLDASTITISESVGSVAGKNMVSINLSNDSDFTTGSQYQVWLTPDTETLDTQTIAECIAVFTIESASEQSMRLFREKVYPACTLGASGSHSTTVIDATGVLDAQTQNSHKVGECFWIHDATDDRVELVRCTANTGVVLTVEMVDDGGTMSFTPASGDHLWSAGPDPMRGAQRAWAKSITEAYSTDGSDATPAQLLYEISALLGEFAVSSTTMTVKKRDGSTAAMTFTLNDATTPTAITRAT